MKYILIILTFYQPNVPVSIIEMSFDTPTECHARMEKFEKMFLAETEKDAKFGYTLRCEERDE